MRCPRCNGNGNHAEGFDCRTSIQLPPLDVLRHAVTIQFQRINNELRDLRAEVEKLKGGNK